MSVNRPALSKVYKLGLQNDLPWLLLFSLMLFVPTTYKFLKAVLLSVCLIQCILSIANKKLIPSIHPTVITWLILMLANGLYFVIRGGFNDAPGAMRVLTVVALWPTLFVFLSHLLAHTETLARSLKVCVYSTIAVTVYAIYFLLYESGFIPASLYFAIDMGQASSIQPTSIEFTLHSFASLLFLVPCLLAGVFVWKGYFSKRFIRTSWLALFLGAICVVLSGRRALQLVTALAPFVFLFFWLLLPPLERKKSSRSLFRISLISGFSALVFVMLLITFNFSVVDSMIARFSEGFQFRVDTSAAVRVRQLFDLSMGWKEAPLLGHGWGSVAKGLIRDVQMPWAYELFYSAALFQLGLLGFLIYAAGIGWIYFTGSRIIREGGIYGAIMLPLLTGMTCFLIANGTNPYLAKFDCMWVVFFPVACINSWLLQKRNHIVLTNSIEEP
jgi:hypothetical protein